MSLSRNYKQALQSSHLHLDHNLLSTKDFKKLYRMRFGSAFFTPNTLNICTDASKKGNNKTSAIAVYLTYTDENWDTKTLFTDVIYLDNATISESEMTGIAYGMYLAKDYQDIKVCNIFTDSLISINKIRDYQNSNISPDTVSFKLVVEELESFPIPDINVYYFKAHCRDVGFMYQKFYNINKLDITLYDIKFIGAMMAYVDYLANISSTNEISKY